MTQEQLQEPRLVDWSFPDGVQVVHNLLYETTDPAYLTEDMLLLECPGEMFIDVSWRPEHDPDGRYYVTIFKHGYFHYPREKYDFKNLINVKAIVCGRCNYFWGPRDEH